MKSPLFYLSARTFLLLCTFSAGCAADDTQSLLAHAKQAAGGQRRSGCIINVSSGSGLSHLWPRTATVWVRLVKVVGVFTPASRVEPAESFPRLHRTLDDLMLRMPRLWVAS
jgi:hypothetical protein